MLVSIGRMPTAIASALGGVSLGSGFYTVLPAVAAMARAFGGVVVPLNAALNEDGRPLLNQDGSFILKE